MKDWLLHVAIEKDEKMAYPTMAVTDRRARPTGVIDRSSHYCRCGERMPPPPSSSTSAFATDCAKVTRHRKLIAKNMLEPIPSTRAVLPPLLFLAAGVHD